MLIDDEGEPRWDGFPPHQAGCRSRYVKLPTMAVRLYATIPKRSGYTMVCRCRRRICTSTYSEMQSRHRTTSIGPIAFLTGQISNEPI